MIEERAVSEEEMLLEFVKSEYGDLINDPDLSDAEQNARRAHMLEMHRGYTSRRGLFRNFPHEVHWRLAKLTTGDFERLRYVNSSPWRPLTGLSLRVIDGASRIAERTFDPKIDGIERCASKIWDIARSIQHGGNVIAALILADVEDGRLVVIEGNHRATAFVIANVGSPIPALIGSSPGMARWSNQTWT
jgi:hypothetical protein